MERCTKDFHFRSYAGKILRVDFSTGRAFPEALDWEITRDYLGGVGLGAKLLWDEVGPHVDPFDPDNRLVLAAGPLSGTSWPGSDRLALVSKSPLTGMYGDSNAGGFFASELKAAGYDAIVLEGKANSPVYLYVHDAGVELRPADHLWGQGTVATEELVLGELRNNAAAIAGIGPAGEKLVRFASVQFSGGRSASRCGMGAVMGSKNLKAIAVRGTRRIPLAHPEDYEALVQSVRPSIVQDDSFPSLATFGSLRTLSLANSFGRLSARNSQLGAVPFIDRIDEGAFMENCDVEDVPCRGCLVSCGKTLIVREGEFAGARANGLGFEGAAAFGSGIWNDNLGAIVAACHACDDLGLDVTSAGRVIAFSMELYQRGLLTSGDADGIELAWGSYDAALALIRKIASRQGIGDVLAEGVKRAAEQLGGEAEQYSLHVKGLELPGRDPRAQQSLGLALAVASRGADHLKAVPMVDLCGKPSSLVDRYGHHRLPELADPLSPRHKALVVKDGEDLAAAVDSLGICKIASTHVIAAAYWPSLVQALRLATGMDLDERALKLAGERVVNTTRCYNILHGATRDDDRLPHRLTHEPLPSGLAQGRTVEIDTLLDEYYLLREWDLETGYPTPRKLIELGMEDISLALGL